MSDINYDNTYILFEENPEKFSLNRLRFHLNKYNLIEDNKESILIKHPKFIWFKYIQSINKNILNEYNQKKVYFINKLLNTDCITNKYFLYENFKKHFPKTYLNYMQESFLLTNDTKFNIGDLIITRPVNFINTNIRTSTGKDVYIYHDNATLKIAKNNLHKYDYIIASKYINNPLLFKGKKFHFRVYLIVTIINNVFSSYFFRTFKIITSKNNYEMNNYQNAEIHDTHYKYNDNDYLFPDSFIEENLNIKVNDEIINKIIIDIKNICAKMSYIYYKDAKLMNNSKNGSHMFGCDFMIDSNLNIKLLECNRYLDLYCINKQILLENNIFDWINEIILKPLFLNENPDYINNISAEPILKKNIIK